MHGRDDDATTPVRQSLRTKGFTAPIANALAAAVVALTLAACGSSSGPRPPAPVSAPSASVPAGSNGAPSSTTTQPAPASTASAPTTEPGTSVGSTPVTPAPAAIPGQPRAGMGAALPPPDGAMNLSPVSFAELPGWTQDDFAATLPALDQNCKAVRGKAPWGQICAQAARLDRRDPHGIRSFFERNFQPHRLAAADNNDNGLVTGYYEPLLRGSRQRRGPYQHPVLKLPSDLVQVDLGTVYPELKNLRLRGRLVGNKIMPYGSRAEMDASGYMNNPANVLLWVDDPVEAFFLGIQGSGRIKLDDGSTTRVGYADQNGHPYKSIGRWLIDQGELRADQATMQGIKAWVAANPARARQTLNVNPSVVFFREMPATNADEGPVGSLNVPLTAGRSIAVDPRFIQLGTPVYLVANIPAANAPGSGGQQPLQRLVFAQDTGSAIKGAVRADWFTGFGEAAGELAGRMKQAGKMYLLLPRAN